MEVLNLSGNQLLRLPPELGNLTALEAAYLADNWLTSVPAALGGKPLHSSTLRLNVSTFCGIRWVQCFLPGLLERGTREGVTKTAEVELISGRM